MTEPRKREPPWVPIALTLILAGAATSAGEAPVTGLERAALAAAGDAVSTPDWFEPGAFRFGGEAPPPDAEFDLLDIDGPNQSGLVRMTFAVVSDEPPREVFASVRGSVRGHALVAKRPAIRGEVIDADAVELVEVDLTRLRHEPLRDPARLAGKVPVRTLGAGRVITEDLLQPMPVVRRNQAVKLHVLRPGLSVSASGTALSDGAPGESITAVNTSTGARVLCEVQADGSLRVIRGLGTRVKR